MSISQLNTARILHHFGQCTDPRTRPVTYPLLEVILIVFLSTICGEEGWEAMEEWAEDKLPFLRKLLPYEDGVPSPDTLRRVVKHLNPQEFLSSFTSWATEFKERHGGQICIDGKCLKRAKKDGKPLHLVSAWCEENRLVLGGLRTDSKSNEIPAIKELLESLTLMEGDIVTIDAIGCQKDITREINRQGADYVIALKKNQHSLASEVENFFEQAVGAKEYVPCVNSESQRKGHGREEEHSIWVTDDISWLPQANDWDGLASLIMVQRKWLQGDKERKEIRYYISSLKGIGSRIEDIIRRHWSIENNLHWHLDVTFGEDDSRIEGSANENLRVARMVALDTLRAETTFKKSLKARSRKCARSEPYLEKVLMAGNF